MHHLDVVPGAACAHPGDARLAIFRRAGRDGSHHGADTFPGASRAAGHQAGTPQRAGLTAGHAHADELDAVRSQRRHAAIGVGEVGVAAVDDDVAGCQIGLQRCDSLVDRIAGRHHQQNRPRRLQRAGQLLQRVGDLDVETLRQARRQVVADHRVAVALEVLRQAAAHDAQAEDSQSILLVHQLHSLFPCLVQSGVSCPNAFALAGSVNRRGLAADAAGSWNRPERQRRTNLRHRLLVISCIPHAHRWMRADPPLANALTCSTVAMVVSPGKVVSSAPCAQPRFTASCSEAPVNSP